MKIAIPTNDGTNICGHFGRTKGFKIFKIENGEIVKEEIIENNFTGHAQGQHTEHSHGEGHQQHSHAGIFSALAETKVVIANGMGRRLYDEFQTNKMEVFITKESNIEKAMTAYLTGMLDNNESSCCNH